MAATMRRRPSGQAGQASPQEASAEQSAAQVLLEGLEDEGGWRASPDVLRGVTEGVEVVISSVRRSGWFADIKTGSLIHQVQARHEANSKGAYEAILLTADEKLSDGITSNIYLVRDGKILTPAHDAGIVEGITRGVVLDLAREIGLQVVEALFDVEEIGRADEMFLTSSTREVVPIARVNGVPVGGGKPGPVTLALLQAYRSALDRLIAED